MLKCVLTIAGSDSGAGAGIQADLKTMAALRVYGLTVITAVTAQNTTGVQRFEVLSEEMVAAQIDAVMKDFPVVAVKTGMLGNAGIISTVAAKLKEYGARRVVVDPVMVAKSGDPLLEEGAQEAFKQELFPLVLVITPNISEAEVLCGFSIGSVEDMKRAARFLQKLGPAYVLIKGGHYREGEEVVDLLFDGEKFYFYRAPRLKTTNTHGTGCSFASAIASYLARGYPVPRAVQKARSYLQFILHHGLDLGQGNGPMDHMAFFRRKGFLR